MPALSLSLSLISPALVLPSGNLRTCLPVMAGCYPASEGEQPRRRGLIERGQGVDAGGREVMHRAGLGLRDPRRQPPMRSKLATTMNAPSRGRAGLQKRLEW